MLVATFQLLYIYIYIYINASHVEWITKLKKWNTKVKIQKLDDKTGG